MTDRKPPAFPELPAGTVKATIIEMVDGRLQQWSYRDGALTKVGKPCDGLAYVTMADGQEHVVMLVNDWSEAAK